MLEYCTKSEDVNYIPILSREKWHKDNGYVHSDIKPPNILYNIKSKKYFIIDFGLTKHRNDIYDDDIYYEYTIGGENPYRYWPKDSGHIVFCEVFISRGRLTKQKSLERIKVNFDKRITVHNKEPLFVKRCCGFF